jgi:hypothetical protein
MTYKGDIMQAAVHPYAMAGAALAGVSLIAATPMAAPVERHVTTAAVRLTSGGSDLLGDLGNLGGLTTDLGDLGNLGGLTTDLGDLGNLGGLTTDLGSLANFGGLLDSGSLLNIPYNLFADVVNIPYEESLALEEYAYALGPAGTTGGVAGWLPPGATVLDGGATPDGLYTLGGTGSWYMESLGNTWGWDDGNWPQLAAISNFLLPFSFTDPIAAELQGFAQSEFIDGASIGCEFECANPVGYLGGWLHGDTSLPSLLSGTTFPTTLEDSVGDTGYTNLFYLFGQLISPNTSGNPPTGDVIWSDQPGAQLNLLEPLQAIAGNLTASPSADPIQFPDLGSVFSNALTLGKDIVYDFSPFEEGSFLWWGAATDYSIPTAIGGTITDFTGIPNQFGFPADQTLGSEPLLTGYTSNPLDLPGGFAQGLQYFLDGNGGTAGNGLLGYLNPEIYLYAIENDLSLLTNPDKLLAALPLVGYLGLGNDVAGAVAPGSLFGTFEPAVGTTVVGGPLDLGPLDLGSLDLGSFDPGTLLGGALDPTTLTTDLSALLPNVGGDLTSILGGSLATDLSSLLSSSAVNVVPDLALQLLTAI